MADRPGLRNDPEANRLFLDILTSSNAPEVVLRRMNEAGVLGRFIPDFGRIVAMMQFNMYHHYTVDEHLLRSIGVLAEIEPARRQRASAREPDLPVDPEPSRPLRRALPARHRQGPPEDHSSAGAAIARKLGPRFGLDAPRPTPWPGSSSIIC